MTLLVATRNRHKLKELRRLFRGMPVRFLTLERFPGVRVAPETGTTFRENAVKKAVSVSRQTILPVLGEDSGLEVSALGGRPGVRSARFAGAAQNDRANNRKLLRLLDGLPLSRRRGRFVCAMALAAGGRLIRTFEGRCSGSIASEPAGRTGFGYDPLFIPAGCRKTMAQLGPRAKDALSHRARAARRLCRWLRRPLPGSGRGFKPRLRGR